MAHSATGRQWFTTTTGLRLQAKFDAAPLTGDDRNEQRYLASQPWFRVALSHAPPGGR